jgi:hypothetical protein
MNSKRWKLLTWLNRRYIFGVEDIKKLSVNMRWLVIVRWILMPIRTFKARAYNEFYDIASDIYTIEGQKYSGELFRAWGKNGIPTGTPFMFERRVIGGEPVIGLRNDYKIEGNIL